MPVLPLVASTIVVRPGSIRPSRSAASIIATPMRSLTLPPGLAASSLPYSSTCGASRLSRTSRVSPTHCVMSAAIGTTFSGDRAARLRHRDHLRVGEIVEQRVVDPVEHAVIDPADVLDVVAVAPL